MKRKNRFAFKTLFVCAVVLLLFKTVTFAEAFGPVGSAMHTMSADLECVSGGDLAAFFCGFDSGTTTESAAKNKTIKVQSAQEFAQAAKSARAGLLQVHANEPEKIQTLNTLFDQLDGLAIRMATAVSNDDSAAIDSVVDEITKVRTQGHAQFLPPRIKFNNVQQQ